LSLPPEVGTNFKSDRRSDIFADRLKVLIFLPHRKQGGGGRRRSVLGKALNMLYAGAVKANLR
ncbi:MAG: hypothetical protein ACP5Q3_14965, partial [bacterium]